MDSSGCLDSRPLATKKSDSLPSAKPASSAPKSFVLKTEREMEASVQRGRKSSRSAVISTDVAKDIPDDDRPFGVQSLEETLSSLPPEDNASRAASISTDRSSEANTEGNDISTPAKRQRRTGNRVHPSIR